MNMLGDVMQETAGVRRPGAAALDLAYVAAGFADGFFESGLQIWDVAAGSLLVTEAGGLVGNFTGEADFLEQKDCPPGIRSEEHTSELQSQSNLVCRLLLEKKKKNVEEARNQVGKDVKAAKHIDRHHMRP